MQNPFDPIFINVYLFSWIVLLKQLVKGGYKYC